MNLTNQPPKLPQYSVIERLGQGGMSCVYLAEDNRLKRTVALKTLNTSTKQSVNALNEAQLLASLNHPNIVQIYDIIEQPNQLILVIEYVEGQSLSTCLQQQLASLEQKLQWLAQISEALCCVHQAKIIHCDIKAANIIINQQGQAKLIDFGISLKPQSNDSNAHSQYGSVGQMAPEILMQQPATEQSDLFSLGILAFELFANHHPFGQGSAEQLSNRIINTDAMDATNIQPTIPAKLATLINQLLARNPNQRPGQSYIVAEQFNQILVHLNQAKVLDEQTIDLSTIQTAQLAKGQPPAAQKPQLITIFSFVTALLVISSLVIFSPWHKQTPTEYIAISKPQIEVKGAIADNHQQLITATLQDALAQAVLNQPSLMLIAFDEFNQSNHTNLETTTRLAQQAGATALITTEAQCDNNSCNISINHINSNTGTVVNRAQWQNLTESYTGMYKTAQSKFQLLFKDLAANQEYLSERQIAEQHYTRYLQLYYAVHYQGIKTNTQLTQLQELLNQAPYLFAAYRLYVEIATYLHQQTAEPQILVDLKQQLNQAPPQYRYSQFHALDMFWLALAEKQLDDAKQHIEDAQQRGASQTIIIELNAAWHQANKDYQRSAKYYQQALKLRPSRQLYYSLALNYWWLGDYQQAKSALLALVALAPDYYQGNQLLAAVHLMLGEIEKAAQNYQAIITKAQDNAQSIDLNNLSIALSLNGQYQQALIMAERATHKSPANPTWLLNLADAQMLTGNQPQAQQNYQQVLSLHQNNNDITAKLESAQAFAQLNQAQNAIRALNEAKKLAPNNGSVALTAALVYNQLGEQLSALVAVEEALKHNIGPVWFHLPWFDSLCQKPQFEQLLIQFGGKPRCS